jgi:hypothetical protein
VPKRFAIYQAKQAPPSFDGDPRGEMSRDNCSIMDKHQTEPNPQYPGRIRYKFIESGLTYLDAYPEMKKLNEEYERGQQETRDLPIS